MLSDLTLFQKKLQIKGLAFIFEYQLNPVIRLSNISHKPVKKEFQIFCNLADRDDATSNCAQFRCAIANLQKADDMRYGFTPALPHKKLPGPFARHCASAAELPAGWYCVLRAVPVERMLLLAQYVRSVMRLRKPTHASS